MKLFVIIFQLFFFLQAEEHFVKGIILDKTTKTPLPAYVMLERTEIGCSANEDGIFTLKMPIPKGRIKIYLLGYQTKVLDVKGGEILTIELKPEPLLSYQVTVTADSQVSDETGQKTVTMKTMDVYNTPGTAADPLYAASILPGVNSTPDSSSMFIRGGAADEVTYFFDGIEIDHPVQSETLHESYFSIFDNQVIEKFNISTSGFSPKFGNALSGVMDITARDSAHKRDVGIGLSIIGSNGFVAFPIKNFGSFIGSFEKGYSSLMTNMNNRKGFSFATDNLFSKLNIKLGRSHSLKLIGLYDRYKYFEESGFDFTARNKIFGFTILSALSKNLMNIITLSHVSSRIIILSGDVFNKEVTDKVIQGRFDLAWDLKSHYIELGGNFRKRRIDLCEVEDYQAKANLFGLYFNDKVRVLHSLFVNLGGRVDYINLGRKFCFSPRLSAAYFISNTDILRISTGIYHQYGDIFELKNFSALKPKKAFHCSLSYDKITDETNLRVTIYNKNYNNLFLYKNDVITNNGYGYAIGGEFYIKKNKKRYDFIFVYNLLKSKRKEKEAKTLLRSPYEIDHSFTAIFIKKWKYLSLGIRYSYARGFPYTPLIGREWNEQEKIYAPIWGELSSSRYPSYNRADINGKKIFNFKNLTVVAYFGIMNVLNYKNTLRYEYHLDYSFKKNVYSLFARTIFFGCYVIF